MYITIKKLITAIHEKRQINAAIVYCGANQKHAEQMQTHLNNFITSSCTR